MKDTQGKEITEEDFLKGETLGVVVPREHVLKIKLKKDNTRLGVYYLTTFYNGKQITIDSWERPKLFKELLAFVAECETDDVSDSIKEKIVDRQL